MCVSVNVEMMTGNFMEITDLVTLNSPFLSAADHSAAN